MKYYQFLLFLCLWFHVQPKFYLTAALVDPASAVFQRYSSNQRLKSTIGPLYYRNHDEKDDDSSMLKLKTRAAPTFTKTDLKMKYKRNQGGNGINRTLLISLLLNQLFIVSVSISITSVYLFFTADLQFLSDGILNWTGHLDQYFSNPMIGPIRILEGVFGSIPMILFGTTLERSEDRRFAKANFSTVFMVMTLFGRRSQVYATDEVDKDKIVPNKTKLDRLEPITKWSDVALISAGLSSVTGFCEELTFRGMIPHVMISTIFGGNILLTLIGQAILFGLGHISLTESFADNLVVPSIQFMNGLWLGFIYLSTNGDILPCIIAHALYDFQIFFFTWMKANDQIEYAFHQCLAPIPSNCQMEVNAMKRELGVQIDDEIFELFKRVFYIMDTNKNGTISRSEVQRGISYLDIEGIIIAPSQKTINTIFDGCITMRDTNSIEVNRSIEDELRFSDFIRLLLTVKVISKTLQSKAKNINTHEE